MALLDEKAGHWFFGATNATEVSRRYLDRTMVLETTLRTPTGSVTITDALAMGSGNREHELGKRSASRSPAGATCTEGWVDLSLEHVPRPDYGLQHPSLDAVDGGMTESGSADGLVLSTSVALTLDQDRAAASGRFQLAQGESMGFALHHGNQTEGSSARVWSPSEIRARLEDTVAGWESWPELHQAYVGPWQDMVHHRGRVLQSLSFAPTGAICAAATTSLPEVVGGSRNWDYRYAWVRDVPARSSPFGWRLVPTKPTSSSITSPRPRPARSTGAVPCRSCSASAVNGT